ncbi:MAG: 16S rRNA (cytosine(967)-C(5))-methyltransferase RsmB [Pseudomonadota bacterium]
MSANVRALAARVVGDVLRGAAMDGPLENARRKLDEGSDRAFLGALCLGAVRHGPAHRAVIRRLLSRPDQKLKPDVEALILLGIEQLENMRVAPHAAVSETVAAARHMKQHKATGLINALLRRYQRERERLLAAARASDAGRYNHPSWLLKALKTDWPEHWQEIIGANDAPAPLWLRVNSRRAERSAYIERLCGGTGLTASAGTLSDRAVRVDDRVSVVDLPGFAEGEVTVQDQSAQLAVALMAPVASGARILDACAAPGGKTGHLLERFDDCEVVAVDSSARRLARLNETLARLGHRATTVEADLTDTKQVDALGRFDRVLVDAPCTGTGVIRRHPDIKLLRRAGDSAKLGHTQRAILQRAYMCLKPGGELLYVTCSVLRAENDAVVGDFAKAHPHADIVDVAPDATWGHATEYGRQMLPGEAGSDGFFYARIVKQCE